MASFEKNELWGRQASHTGVSMCGIAYQLSAKKQDHYVSLNPF